MLSTRSRVPVAELAAATGWDVKSYGACREDVCVPLAPGTLDADGTVDLAGFAERMQRPLLHDDAHGVWSLGPSSGGRALETAQAPDLVLPDLSGRDVALSAYRGRKVLIAAWASW